MNKASLKKDSGCEEGSCNCKGKVKNREYQQSRTLVKGIIVAMQTARHNYSMNYLAHAYLSFGHQGILVGNMISDFVKGNKRFAYPDKIQQGIILHRQIDAFTDIHEATKEAKSFLKPAAGLYAGAFVDVAYDHFLANDSNEFADGSLGDNAERTYKTLSENYDILPLAFQTMLPYMKSQNWLYNYKSLSGTRSSFAGLVRRAKYLDNFEKVFELFQKHYYGLRDCYSAFFPFVKAFSVNQIEQFTD